MANKNVQLQDMSGNNLFPKTLGSVVFNNNNEALGGVEAGAQVNVIEDVTINGSSGTLTNKTLAFTIDQDAYTIVEKSTANTGYAKTYQLKKGDTVVSGSDIDIPKDFLLKSASMGVCETADSPLQGLAVGDPYLDFVINTVDSSATAQHIYINVKDLVDVYTAGTGISISNNEVSVDSSVVALQTDIPDVSSFIDKDVNDLTYYTTTSDLETALAGKVAKNDAITGATKCKITFDSKGLVTGGADLQASDIPSLDSAKITTMGSYAKAQTASAIATTDTLDQAIGKLEKGLDGKANSATSLAGYGILDGITFVELS